MDRKRQSTVAWRMMELPKSPEIIPLRVWNGLKIGNIYKLIHGRRYASELSA
jgi:hypothetical protein